MEKMSLLYSPTENLTPEASFTVNITTAGELHGHGSGWGAMAVAWPAAREESGHRVGTGGAGPAMGEKRRAAGGERRLPPGRMRARS